MSNITATTQVNVDQIMGGNYEHYGQSVNEYYIYLHVQQYVHVAPRVMHFSAFLTTVLVLQHTQLLSYGLDLSNFRNVLPMHKRMQTQLLA